MRKEITYFWFSQAQDKKTTQPKKGKLFAFSSHFFIILNHLTVVQVSFCSLMKGITLKI